MLAGHRFRVRAGCDGIGELKVSPTVKAQVRILVLVAALAGCSGPQLRNEIAQAWIDALNAHDGNAVARLMAANAVFADPAAPQGLRASELPAWLAGMWVRWPDRVYTARRITRNDHTVAVEWHVQQTGPAGKSVPLNGITLLDVRGDVIQRVDSYYDISPYVQFLSAQK